MIQYRYDRARQLVPAVEMNGAQLARSIKLICDLTDTRLSRFGRDAVGDPRFYYDLIGHAKRQPRHETRLRALAHCHRLAIAHHQHQRGSAVYA
jgi:hypothetical protein